MTASSVSMLIRQVEQELVVRAAKTSMR